MDEKFVYMIFMSFYIFGAYKIYGEQLHNFLPMETISEALNKISKKAGERLIRKNKTYHDRELFSSSVILKNLALVRQETPLSADYIYENLMENSTLLKPMYSEILTLYRSGRDEEAFRIPAAVIGTKAARHFGTILSKLDKLNPAELTMQMEIFQNTMTESRMTYAVKRTQRNSVIVTSLAAVSVFALLINFAVVVVFMDAINILNNVFI